MAVGSHSFRLYPVFFPVSFLYGIGVRLRNFLFDKGIIRSEKFDVPVICIGNLAVGGTGKTPHTEYLIRQLRDRYRIAVLSRGYKRKTKGFVLAHQGSTSQEIGDEPYQVWRNFPDIVVAVDADRRQGINRLLALPDAIRPEVILLDDAFQHRYVHPSFQIVLTDYHRLYSLDQLLPVGRLRESASGARRADLIIVTKCDTDVETVADSFLRKELGMEARQELLFSRIVYGDLEPLFPDEAPRRSLRDLGKGEQALLLSGIAHPEYFHDEVSRYTDQITPLTYPDHHAFDKAELQGIHTVFKGLSSLGKLIIVTEKDAARLWDNPDLPQEWRGCIYQLPITIGFLADGERQFNKLIDNHIVTLKRN